MKVHVTFFLLLAWIGLVYYAEGGPDAAVAGVTFILALFGCALLHEFGHALTARLFGIPTPDITLLPIGGVARMQRMPDKPGQEILVALGRTTRFAVDGSGSSTAQGPSVHRVGSTSVRRQGCCEASSALRS